MSQVETEDRSELADFDDRADFEGFLMSQRSRGVEIVGAERDRLMSVVFHDGLYSDEMTPQIPLRTTEW
ncbi:hypothetical protein JW752_01980 [Candidatus Peregrinibacteria bacterium]|nr:hypothetical protein [Candidatus Peregrinibacteria bacterium]